nr:uncharacterized protein LOC114826106 [Malus domestica]
MRVLVIIQRQYCAVGKNSVLPTSKIGARAMHYVACFLDSYRGSFGLIRKNSVSLFRCSENIERLINGISGTSGDLIHLVTMEAGLILQLEVLVKMLRCVVNVSQQLGKTASAIFYESLVSAPLVISAEEITHRLFEEFRIWIWFNGSNASCIRAWT